MVSKKIANLSGVKSHMGSNPVPSSILILITILLLVITGCCDPNKPVAMIYHTFKSYEIGFNIVKGYDCDCDADIDYWQHYDGDEPFGPKIYTKGNEGKCDTK